MSLALLFHYLWFNMFQMLIHPSSGACDLCVELFHGLYCSGSMCVGVTLWFGCDGVVSVCRLKPVGLSLLNNQDDARSNKHKICIIILLFKHCCQFRTTWHHIRTAVLYRQLNWPGRSARSLHYLLYWKACSKFPTYRIYYQLRSTFIQVEWY